MLAAVDGNLAKLVEEIDLLEEKNAAGVLARDAAVHRVVGDAEERHVREIRCPAADHFAMDSGH